MVTLKKIGLQSLFLLLLFSVCFGNEIYVSNDPFEHTLVQGESILLDLQELGKVLELEAQSVDGGWNFGDYPIKTVELSGKVWVRLEDLPADLIQVKKSLALGTIDIYQVSSETKSTDWGGDLEVVFFFLKDSIPCQNMNSTVETVEESRQVTVTRVDVAQRRSRLYKKYRDIFQTNRVPFFVVLDSNGYYLHHFSDYKTYSQFMAELGKAISKKN